MKTKLISFVPGISRVISNITPIIILFVLTKFVNPDQIGILNYFISLITLIGVFTDFGLPEAVQRFLSHYDVNKLIFPTIVLEFILTTVAGFIFVVLDIISGYQISYNNTWIIFWILVFSASNVVILIFNGLQNNLKTSLYFLGSALLFILLTFTFYFTNSTDAVGAFLWGRVISWGIFSIIPIIDLYRAKLLNFVVILPKRFITFAINNFIIIFSYSLFNQWDSILITKTLGEYSNGIYKSVSLLASAPYVVGVVLNTKLLPEYSKLHKENKLEDIKKSFLFYTKILLAGGLILVLLSIPLANLGLSIVYNQEIAGNGYYYFAPILLGISLYVASIPAVSLLQAIGKEGITRNASLVQSIGFVALTTLLLPMFGLMVIPIVLIGINTIFFAVNYIYAMRLIKLEI